MNNIFETDDDTKEELEQTLKVDNRDASRYHKVPRQAFLSAGTLLLSFFGEGCLLLQQFLGKKKT